LAVELPVITKDGHLYHAAKVKDKFVPRVRREAANRLAGLKADVCPFVNLRENNRMKWSITTEAMKVCRWLKPALDPRVGFLQ
jgi:hypothetical protein